MQTAYGKYLLPFLIAGLLYSFSKIDTKLSVALVAIIIVFVFVFFARCSNKNALFLFMPRFGTYYYFNGPLVFTKFLFMLLQSSIYRQSNNNQVWLYAWHS